MILISISLNYRMSIVTEFLESQFNDAVETPSIESIPKLKDLHIQLKELQVFHSSGNFREISETIRTFKEKTVKEITDRRDKCKGDRLAKHHNRVLDYLNKLELTNVLQN
jgi:hypothetical protein